MLYCLCLLPERASSPAFPEPHFDWTRHDRSCRHVNGAVIDDNVLVHPRWWREHNRKRRHEATLCHARFGLRAWAASTMKLTSGFQENCQSPAHRLSDEGQPDAARAEASGSLGRGGSLSADSPGAGWPADVRAARWSAV